MFTVSCSDPFSSDSDNPCMLFCMKFTLISYYLILHSEVLETKFFVILCVKDVCCYYGAVMLRMRTSGN